MIATTEAATILLKARTEGKRIDCLPEVCRPKDLKTAYQCQDELTQFMLQHYGGKIIGYKIAVTNQAVQKKMNLDAPFYGPLKSVLFKKI